MARAGVDTAKALTMEEGRILSRAQAAYDRARGFARVGPVKLPLDRTVLSRRIEAKLARGTYEAHEAAAARKLLRDGDVVVELGGGLGYISTYLRRMTKIGWLVTYEANPDLIPYILNVHRINRVKEIEVRHGIVLSDPPGDALPFYIREDFWDSSLSGNEGAVTRIVEVPTVSWSAVLDELKPSAAIIDIEGGELDLLEADSFGSIERLIVEAHPALYGIPGMKRLFDGLAQHGFGYAANGSSGSVLGLERSPTSHPECPHRASSLRSTSCS